MPVRVRNAIIRNISPFEITKATVASLWKHSFVQDTFVRNRTAFERFAGIPGTHYLIHYLKKKIVSSIFPQLCSGQAGF